MGPIHPYLHSPYSASYHLMGLLLLGTLSSKHSLSLVSPSSLEHCSSISLFCFRPSMLSLGQHYCVLLRPPAWNYFTRACLRLYPVEGPAQQLISRIPLGGVLCLEGGLKRYIFEFMFFLINGSFKVFYLGMSYSYDKPPSSLGFF